MAPGRAIRSDYDEGGGDDGADLGTGDGDVAEGELLGLGGAAHGLRFRTLLDCSWSGRDRVD